MPVDRNAVSGALQLSRNGQNLKALAELYELMNSAESDTDRAALVLGQASCHSHLGNLTKSAGLLDLAKHYVHQDRLILSQVALSSASLRLQKREFEAACNQYESIKAEYHDLLSVPEHEDFAIELDSRLACALVDAERYGDAIPILRNLLERSGLEDKQRLQVFFSFALYRTGRIAEAQPILFEAAAGKDRQLAQTALDYLAEIEASGLA